MDWLPPSLLLGCITVLGGVIAYLFRLLYFDIKGDRDHYRDQLMPSVKTLVDALASLQQDFRAISEAQAGIRDDIKRIREEVFYRRGAE